MTNGLLPWLNKGQIAYRKLNGDVMIMQLGEDEKLDGKILDLLNKDILEMREQNE